MSLSIETRCIHGKWHANKDELGAIVYPIYQTASFSHIKPGHNQSGFDYSRESNPTRSFLEETMSSLDGAAGCIAYSTGMSAVSAVFEYFRPGDHIICGLDLYGGVNRLVQLVSNKNGLEVEFTDTTDLALLENAVRENTRGIYFETPSNPMMHVTDIRKAAEIAHKAGALLIVDNTLMTPYFQNPIALGADIVVYSGTKYIGGHNDTLCGLLCIADAKTEAKMRLLSKTTGAVLGPFDCWLISRGLKTLAVRMERHRQNGERVAAWLKRQPYVRQVFYAGDKEHPQYELHASQARGTSGMISFEVDSKDTAVKILENVRLITFAESLGGTETLITYPIVQTHPDVPEETKGILGISDRLLRLSVGLENPDDIIADLERAAEE